MRTPDFLKNLTPYPAAFWFGKGVTGRTLITASIKTTYVWNDQGRALPHEPLAILESDEVSADGPAAALLRAAEIGAPKPRVDVLIAGALVFPVPVAQVDVSLAVGQRIAKTVRAFGDRIWVPGMLAEMVPSKPRPVTRVPIDWTRAFGGHDPEDLSYQETRNPAGTGFVRRAKSLEGRPAPNFEDPSTPLGSWKDRPAPRGFGPVAAHWQPRASLAGTYDEAWQRDRSPLLPVDFDVRFFNVAPADQQLDYYQAGEEIRLTYMSRTGHDRFALPDVSVPVTFVTSDELIEAKARVDTILIEPEERRFSLIARAACSPESGIAAFREAIVGQLSAGVRRAVERGKRYRATRPQRRKDR